MRTFAIVALCGLAAALQLKSDAQSDAQADAQYGSTNTAQIDSQYGSTAAGLYAQSDAKQDLAQLKQDEWDDHDEEDDAGSDGGSDDGTDDGSDSGSGSGTDGEGSDGEGSDGEGTDGEGSGSGSDGGSDSGSEGDWSGDEEDDSPGTEDIYYTLFQLYDIDGSGSISSDEFNAATAAMVTELEANGYESGVWGTMAADSDMIYDMLDTEWVEGEDDDGWWTVEGVQDDSVDYDAFVAGIDEIAWQYGLSEWELGLLLLGMADHDGDWYVTEEELEDWAARVGLDADPQDLQNWFDEVDQGEETWEGEPAVSVWAFASWWQEEEFVAAQDVPKTREWIEIAFDTIDTDGDGEISYFDTLDYVRHFFDVQADEGKIQRSWYPDEDVEREVRYFMEELASSTVPIVSRDQAVYALSQGDDQVDAYVVGDLLSRVFETGDEDQDGVERSDVQGQADLYDLDVSGDDLRDIFDRMDTDGDGVISDEEWYAWMDSQSTYNHYDMVY